MSGFFIVSLAMFVVWLTFFLFSNETRREQLIMSIVGLVLSPGVILIAAEDYRRIVSDEVASVGIEDLLFAFALFGIAAVIYQILLGQHTHKLRGKRYEIAHVGHWVGHLVIALGLWVFFSLLMINVFDLPSMQSLIVGGLLVGTYIIADRHDLLLNALLSGLFVAALVFIVEQIFFVRLFPIEASSFWQLDSISTFIVGGVPLEEIVWAATVGFAIGPLYEWLRRYELK